VNKRVINWQKGIHLLGINIQVNMATVYAFSYVGSYHMDFMLQASDIKLRLKTLTRNAVIG